MRRGWLASLNTLTLTLVLGALAGNPPARAQTREQSATYVSQIDQDLTIRRIALLPVSDNVDGIYSRPVEAQLTQLLKNSHRWDFVEASIAASVPALVELEENPTEVQNLVQPIDADAFIGGTISRGPNGLSLRLDLFLKRDGKVLSQEILRDHPRFELAELRDRVNELYRKLVGRIPYDGLLLSRQGNRVTINLGKSDGITKDQIVTAVQIIALNRHPRFNFIVSSEKEILGRIKILKVEDTLSFGAIISEKEKDVVRRFAKISGLEQVNYPEPTRLDESREAGDVGDRPDAAVTFGKDPKEWLPTRPPSFGQLGAHIGLGMFNSSVALEESGTLQASSSLYPSVGLEGEMWLTPQWTIRAEILQGVISTANPRASASNTTLNYSMSRYSLALTYNFLLRDDFFGPKFGFTGGFAQYRMYVDGSTPDAFETTSFAGAFLGIGGSFPVTEDKLWYLGGRLNLFLMPSMVETPRRTGSDYKSSVNEFSVLLERKISENLRATGSLDFSLYSSNISGQGTRVGPTTGVAESGTNFSQRHTVLTGGIVYMY